MLKDFLISWFWLFSWFQRRRHCSNVSLLIGIIRWGEDSLFSHICHVASYYTSVDKQSLYLLLVLFPCLCFVTGSREILVINLEDSRKSGVLDLGSITFKFQFKIGLVQGSWFMITLALNCWRLAAGFESIARGLWKVLSSKPFVISVDDQRGNTLKQRWTHTADLSEITTLSPSTSKPTYRLFVDWAIYVNTEKSLENPRERLAIWLRVLLELKGVERAMARPNSRFISQLNSIEIMKMIQKTLLQVGRS